MTFINIPNEDFTNDISLVNSLLEENKVSTAYSIASYPKYQNCLPMQELLIECLIRLNRITDAYNLASMPQFNNYFPIQNKLIEILIKQKKYILAYKLAKKTRFKDYLPIQFNLITILLILHNNKKALKLAKEPRFENDPSIQFLVIATLMQMHEFDEAYNFAINCKFKDDKRIQQRIRILERKVHKTSYDIKNDTLADTLRGIKDNEITEREIEALELSTFQKEMLLVLYLYANHFPDKVIINTINRLKDKYQNTPIALNTIKYFFDLVKQKRKFFDIERFYNAININIADTPNR